MSNFSYQTCQLTKTASLQFGYLVFYSNKLMSKFHLVGAIVACCLCSTVQAQVFHGRVDRVIDGDTIVVITEDDNIRVRIRGIDAPESNQEFGGESRLALEELLNGRTVVLKSDQQDRYGRTLASVAVSGTDVGLYMIENGYAWYYEAYGLQIPVEWQKAYRLAQADAKSLQVGLWQGQGVIPPWTWRKHKREEEKVSNQEHRESLKGITEELESNFRTLEDNLSDLRDEYLSDNVPVTEEEKTIQKAPDEQLSWWELFMKIGEGISRWIKAFFMSKVSI